VPAAALRELLGRAVDMHAGRGTAAGMREQIELETGIRVRIEEDFRQRRIWRLGCEGLLGTGTALAPLDPAGLVVPDSEATPVVGGITVGEVAPLTEEGWADSIFAPTAHRFQIVVPPGQLACPEDRDRLEQVIESQRPAHADYHVCVVEPLMRAGMQARLGVDAVVAGPPRPGRVGGARLEDTAVLGSVDTAADEISRSNTRVGMRIG
jgi:hypothetical protein